MSSVDRHKCRASGEALLQTPALFCQPKGLTSVHAEELLATHGKTFHFAARFFPVQYRQAVVSLYAFFRTLDDLVDERGASWNAKEVRCELERWQTWLCADCASPAPQEPLGTLLATLLHAYQLPVTLFLDFLDGLFSDLDQQEFQQVHELYRYCYQVAGTVGLAMAYVLGERSEQALTAARELGIAMQLTNILRDVGRDLATGRIYLPQEELTRFGFSRIQFLHLYQQHQGPNERFRQLMYFQIQRARSFYRKGLSGVWLLAPECRPPILLAGRLYQRILTEIERRQYDVLRERAATSLFMKAREAVVVLLLDSLWRGGEAVLTPEMEGLYEED
jgi:15-cis-phytoene synthase